MSERWKPILDGNYAVSNCGRLKRLTDGGPKTYPGKILKTHPDRTKYLTTRLRFRGRYIDVWIHVLVAEAFIGPCPKGKEVNHKDLNRQNNCDWNLEYLTHRENAVHARDAGAHSEFKLNKATADNIRQVHGISELSYAAVGRIFEVSGTHVSNIVSGKVWT